MSRLTRDGTAEPVSRDQILRHARGQGNIHFPCSADHEQDWQPYPVDSYSAICDDHTYIHTFLGANEDRKKKKKNPVQLTTSTIGKHTRLIHTLLKVADHTYIQYVRYSLLRFDTGAVRTSTAELPQ